jgi:hypothetical protein
MIPPVTRACCERTPKGVPEPRILYETTCLCLGTKNLKPGALASLQDAPFLPGYRGCRFAQPPATDL